MIKYSYICQKGQVFVSCPETDEEDTQLRTLADEVTMICKATKSTGLWIVARFAVNGRTALATSLSIPVEISSAELSALMQEAERRIASEVRSALLGQ